MIKYTMRDWLNAIAEAEGFDWDAGNSAKNFDKHHVLRSEAEEVFQNRPLLLLDDRTHSQTEVRAKAFGKTNSGRLLTVSFTLREKLIRVISARSMHRKERTRYGKEN
jgi:uncharacterized DUF497 family protein